MISLESKASSQMNMIVRLWTCLLLAAPLSTQAFQPCQSTNVIRNHRINSACHSTASPTVETPTSPEISNGEQSSPTTTEISDEDTIRQQAETAPILLDEDNVFDVLAARTAICLLESDIRRDAIGKAAGTQASSATNWINDASAFALKQALDRVRMVPPNELTGTERDQAFAWMRWMKSVPTPMIVDFSTEFRQLVGQTLPAATYELIDQPQDTFLERVGCRLILLPSGASLPTPLREKPASIIMGKLLYGGAIRSRHLKSSTSSHAPRTAGVRQEIKATAQENIPPWMMYGGPDRMYEAVDMGPSAILEVVLLRRGDSMEGSLQGHMAIDGLSWSPREMLDFVKTKEELEEEANREAAAEEATNDGYSPASLSGKDRNDAFRSTFQSSVGGLQPQIDAIVRRVLDGRIIRPADPDDDPKSISDSANSELDSISQDLTSTALEAEELALIGLTPVKGLLLYGPPGCGKTALAREISRALKARAPKIVSAPELLDRWVGGSEKATRQLFADAEAELAACNGDASRSALHVIVIDEIDAVFRERSTADDSGESPRSSVVNQILAKLDGVNAMPNVLLIGMTNRRELLDQALLRPGRLEVQIEIPLPDQEGRREILQIHFRALRERGRLSKRLCCAIDGVSYEKKPKAAGEGSEGNGLMIEDNGRSRDDVVTLSGRISFRKSVRKLFRSIRLSSGRGSSYDLAADYATGGFSGADIAGLVRCAGSIALARARKDGSGIEGLLITLDDVIRALEEVRS